MKATTQDKYGPADVLQLKDIATPVAQAGEVLVKVRAAAIDAGAWHLMTGKPYLIRLGSGLRRPKRTVLGRELAGVVAAVGEGVTGFEPGDEVFGIANGTFAEHVVARPRKLTAKPANLTFEQAAALSISAITALQAVRDSGRVQRGQRVLVIGAGGGVGTFTVQLAKSCGAEVTGVCSTTKTGLVRSIGADHVIDYTTETIPRGRYDVVFDIAGNRKLSELRGLLTPRGTLVIIGNEDGGRISGGMGRVLHAALLNLFVKHRLRSRIATEAKRDLDAVRDLATEGRVTPVVDRVVPLPQVAEAMKYAEAGKARGKVVISIP